MGIIRRASQAGKTSRSKTVIADGCIIQGELKSAGDLHLDGRLDGVVRAVHFSIGNNGVFHGDVAATHVTISGQMEGKIVCDVLEMLHGCQVSAEVQCQDLVIEKGAKFVGTSHRLANQNQPPISDSLPPVVPTPSMIAPTMSEGDVPAEVSKTANTPISRVVSRLTGKSLGKGSARENQPVEKVADNKNSEKLLERVMDIPENTAERTTADERVLPK